MIVDKIEEYSWTVAFAASITLVVVGALASTHMFAGSTLGWTVLGLSAGVTVLSRGLSSPATLVTIALAILGLTGVIPFTTVGLWTAIIMGVGLAVVGFTISGCD